mmetsp:Transcript_76075/g.205175  ORF Transcript_76075/g.205175 Transcript_76075/m.205175 type:complete len:80 (+) Transcript_76075:2-241(+)
MDVDSTAMLWDPVTGGGMPLGRAGSGSGGGGDGTSSDVFGHADPAWDPTAAMLNPPDTTGRTAITVRFAEVVHWRRRVV